ncbi:MAG: hypothetical protein LBB38_00295 [Puniceicoccales bacterium]|jgi:hypothetical protein|nr:hypothetical protein [Puniceicoccales bacterium]
MNIVLKYDGRPQGVGSATVGEFSREHPNLGAELRGSGAYGIDAKREVASELQGFVSSEAFLKVVGLVIDRPIALFGCGCSGAVTLLTEICRNNPRLLAEMMYLTATGKSYALQFPLPAEEAFDRIGMRLPDPVVSLAVSPMRHYSFKCAQYIFKEAFRYALIGVLVSTVQIALERDARNGGHSFVEMQIAVLLMYACVQCPDMLRALHVAIVENIEGLRTEFAENFSIMSACYRSGYVVRGREWLPETDARLKFSVTQTMLLRQRRFASAEAVRGLIRHFSATMKILYDYVMRNDAPSFCFAPLDMGSDRGGRQHAGARLRIRLCGSWAADEGDELLYGFTREIVNREGITSRHTNSVTNVAVYDGASTIVTGRLNEFRGSGRWVVPAEEIVRNAIILLGCDNFATIAIPNAGTTFAFFGQPTATGRLTDFYTMRDPLLPKFTIGRPIEDPVAFLDAARQVIGGRGCVLLSANVDRAYGSCQCAGCIVLSAIADGGISIVFVDNAFSSVFNEDGALEVFAVCSKTTISPRGVVTCEGSTEIVSKVGTKKQILVLGGSTTRKGFLDPDDDDYEPIVVQAVSEFPQGVPLLVVGS